MNATTHCCHRQRSSRPDRLYIKRILLAGVVLGLLHGSAYAQFRELLGRVPHSANAVVLLNMEKALASPMGVREGWKQKTEKSFQSGLTRVPAGAARFVLASQIDFESMKPIWEVAVIDFSRPVSIEELVKARGGIADKVDEYAAAALPNNVYAVKFAANTVAAMSPSNRQVVVRWLRDLASTSLPSLSPYLKKAAGYSDEVGTEIIMAMDLDGAVYPERVVKKLKEKNFLKQTKLDVGKVATLVSGVQGVRVGVRLRQTPSAAVAVDFREDVSALAPVAKQLLLESLSDNGMMIDDLERFEVQVKGTEILLSGELSTSGLRRLLSLVESPTVPDKAPAKETEGATPSPTELLAQKSEKSRQYFQAIAGLFDDLKKDLREVKNLASTTVWFDRYARKIERMPILNVDQELIDYGAFVANHLRTASGSMRTMGIQTAQRQSQHQYVYNNSSSVSGGYDNYGYGFGPQVVMEDRYAGARQTSAARREVKAEEKAIAATDVHQIRDQIIKATTDMRRKMTQKYQIEF